jgi:hypothetical protein
MPTAAQTIIDTLTKGVKPVTRFEDVVSPDSIYNDQILQQFAESQVNPEAWRTANQQYGNFMGNQAQSGGQRFGNRLGQSLLNSLERNRQEQIQTFKNAQKQNLMDFYQNQKEEYYTDPNSFTLNNFNKSAQPYKLDPSKFVGNYGSQLGSYNRGSYSNSLGGLY